MFRIEENESLVKIFLRDGDGDFTNFTKAYFQFDEIIDFSLKLTIAENKLENWKSFSFSYSLQRSNHFFFMNSPSSPFVISPLHNCRRITPNAMIIKYFIVSLFVFETKILYISYISTQCKIYSFTLRMSMKMLYPTIIN